MNYIDSMNYLKESRQMFIRSCTSPSFSLWKKHNDYIPAKFKEGNI